MAISTSEYDTIYCEGIRGCKFWTDNAPASAGLSFVIYRGKAQVTASNEPPRCRSAQCHLYLLFLGTNTYFGFTSKDDVTNWVKNDAGAVGAYIGFFSK